MSPSFENAYKRPGQEVATGKQEDGGQEDEERGPVNIELHFVVIYSPRGFSRESREPQDRLMYRVLYSLVLMWPFRGVPP